MVLRMRKGFDTSARSCRTLFRFIIKYLTDILKRRVISSHTKVRYKYHAHMMAICEKIICAVAYLENRIEYEVGGRVRYHELIVQMVWLIVSVPGKVKHKRVYRQ